MEFQGVVRSGGTVSPAFQKHMTFRHNKNCILPIASTANECYSMHTALSRQVENLGTANYTQSDYPSNGDTRNLGHLILAISYTSYAISRNVIG